MNLKLTRRECTLLTSALGILSLSGCETGQSGPAKPPIRLIDVHAHIFNASDLPAEKFIRIVFLHLYPKNDSQQLLDIRKSDVIDWLINLFLWILGANGAPTAEHEIKVLKGRIKPIPEWSDPSLADELTIKRVSEFIQLLEAPDAEILGNKTNQSGAEELRKALRRAADRIDQKPGTLNDKDLADVAREAYFSVSDIGRYLRWFTLFKLYRYVHVDQWIAHQKKQGFVPTALAPAMIDYSKWLDQKVKSPLEDQVEVVALIANRSKSLAVRGYVAFDPLQEVYFQHGYESKSAIKLVESAIMKSGFAGVKIYPPMGFKPFGNTNDQGYPPHIENNIVKTLGDDLNTALNSLFSLCSTLNAPILAHAAESNGAGIDLLGHNYAKRADPFYWLPVFKAYPTLKVCLAHFGRFESRSAELPDTTPLPSASWEWTFGRHIGAHPNSPVFADISYFSEILNVKEVELVRIATYFKDFLSAFDPQAEHIMFGTDWMMTGIEKGYEDYNNSVLTFLAKYCGLSPRAIDNIFYKNAERFLKP